MGGNALKNYGVRRVDTQTYERIKEYTLRALAPFVSRAQVPMELPGKTSYGDVDILAVLNNHGSPSPNAFLQETFQPRTIKHNGGVYSFNVEDLQVDLILTSESYFDCYYNFLCWGDLSMTLGRVARLYGLKYGVYGLELPVRDPDTDHVIELFAISTDTYKILEFLGYNPETFKKGFSTEEEVKNFVFSSRLIHQGLLTAASENTKARKRDRLRPSFSKWLEWFQQNKEQFPTKEALNLPELGFQSVAVLQEFFPESNVKELYESFMQYIENRKLAREKFSGKHIKEMFPELTPQQFGKLMQAWECPYTKQELVNYVLATPIEGLTKRVYACLQNLT